MRNPRSIYIAFDVFPRPKGSSSHIASMVAALSRRRSPVWLLCCGYGDLPARQTEGEIEIFRHKLFHPNLLRRASEFVLFVERTLAAAGSDVEVCVFRDPWGGAPALDSALTCPMVFEVNALPSWELPYAYRALREKPAARVKIEDLERYCLLSSDRVLTVSETTREALERIGAPRERLVVIPNSASEAFFDARQAAAPLPELSEGKWIGYVGSLHPWQGIETALDGFALAAPDLPETRMLIVHNGRKAPLKALRKRARKRGLAERVLFHPPMSPDRLGAAIARLDFTLAPLRETARNTLQGCCPVKIVESMAAGVPVLASDLRVCRELIAHGENGWLAEPDNRVAWARAIRRLADDPALTARLARAARQKAKDVFDRERIHDRLEACFSKNGSEKNVAAQ